MDFVRVSGFRDQDQMSHVNPRIICSIVNTSRTDALALARRAWGATIPEKTLGLYFGNVARMIGSGVAIPEALSTAAVGLGEELQGIGQNVVPRLRNGVALVRAMEPYRYRFPEMVLPVLEVGEVSGTLEESTRRLAVAFQDIEGFKTKFRAVAIDPLKIVMGAVLFKVLFAVGNAPMDILKVALFTAIEAGLAVFLLRLLYRSLRHWHKFHVLVDKIHLAIPHVGAIARNLATARWARSFATMWHAGVPISQALDVASRSTVNAYYEHEMQKAVVLTRQGKSLSEALGAIELTPRHFLPLLTVGEQTAAFAEALDRYVDALEDEALVKAQQESMGATVVVYFAIFLIAVLLAFGVQMPFLTGS